MQTHRWREMDANFWYRGRKARDFQNIPEAAGMAGSDTAEAAVPIKRER